MSDVLKYKARGRNKMSVDESTDFSVYRMNRNPHSEVYEEQQRAASAVSSQEIKSWIWKNR